MKGRDTTLVGIANMLGRITGMVAEVVMSAMFGAGRVADAFYAASRASQMLRELLVEGSLQNVLVPGFSRAVEEDGLAGAWRLANAFLGVLLLVLGATILFFIVGAPWLIQLFASGYESDAEKFALAVSLTRWLSPFLAGLSLAGFIGGMLNVRGRFFGPALAQNVLNLLVIAGCLAGPTFERATGLPAIVAVALATSLAGFVQCALTLPALLREGFRFRPTLKGHPALWGLLATFGPALIGISTVQANLVIETSWASAFGDGPVSFLSKSFRLVQIPLAVFAGSVATTALPAVAAHFARGEDKELGDTLARALRLNSFLVLPSAVAFGVLAEPLVRLLFERGAFTPADTAGTAAMLQMYAFAVLGICVHRIAVPLYYALGDPKRPMWLSIGAVAAKVPVIYLLINGLGLGVAALPLSHAITVTGECVFLLGGLRRWVAGRGLLVAHLKITLAATGMGALAWGLAPHLNVLLVCVVCGFAYLGAARVLGIDEVMSIGRMKAPGLPPSIDPGTRDALTLLAAGGVYADGLRLSCPRGAWRMEAKGGEMTLVSDGTGPGGDLSGVVAILRPGRPPTLKGVVIGARAWHANGDEVVEGDEAGPHIPVQG